MEKHENQGRIKLWVFSDFTFNTGESAVDSVPFPNLGLRVSGKHHWDWEVCEALTAMETENTGGGWPSPLTPEDLVFNVGFSELSETLGFALILQKQGHSVL